MINDINIKNFPAEAGAYMFKVNNEVIYVGSSKNIYRRTRQHKSCIKNGGDHNGTSKQGLYQILQNNSFVVEFELTDDYRQLEQRLIENYQPKFNELRANTGLGAQRGRVVEYWREWKKKYNKQYFSQKCEYNGEVLTLSALLQRFEKQKIPHAQLEAKKYLIN